MGRTRSQQMALEDRRDEQHHVGNMACPGCGTLLEDVMEQTEALHAIIRDLQERNDILKDEFEKKSRDVRRLQKDADAQLRGSKMFEPAMRVLEFWREHCHPTAVELEGERVKKVIARLQGRPKPYTEEMLKMAVLGYAAFPYVRDDKRRHPTGSPAQRYVDAELIFRDPKHVDQGIAFFQESQRRLNGNGSSPAAPDPNSGRRSGPVSETSVDKAARLIDW